MKPSWIWVRPVATLAATVALATAPACAPASPPTDTTPATNAIATAPASVTLQGFVSAPSRLVAAGGGNLVAAGAGNIVAAAGGSLVAAGGGNMVSGGNLIAAGGGNMVSPGNTNLVAAGGGNLVAAGGGNLVAAGGGNLIAAGGGNLVAASGGNLVAAGGGNLVAAGGGNITFSTGANLVQFGANLVAAGGGNLVAAGGGNLVAAGGGNLVAAGGGNYTTLDLERSVARARKRHLLDLEMAPIAQTPVVHGRVVITDLAGNPIEIPETYTDDQGHYVVPNLPAGQRYIVTVVVGNQAAEATNRVYHLIQSEDADAGSAPPATGNAFADLKNPLVVGVALPPQGEAMPSPTAAKYVAPRGNTANPHRKLFASPEPGGTDGEVYLKTYASGDSALVEANVSLASTMILEALVLSAGTDRASIIPERWATAVENLTPLLREIAPTSLPPALLDAPIIDAQREPLRAREVLEGWTLLWPQLSKPLAAIEAFLLDPSEANALPPIVSSPDPSDNPSQMPGDGPSKAPIFEPDPTDNPNDDDSDTSLNIGVNPVDGGYAAPTANPTIDLGQDPPNVD